VIVVIFYESFSTTEQFNQDLSDRWDDRPWLKSRSEFKTVNNKQQHKDQSAKSFQIQHHTLEKVSFSMGGSRHQHNTK